MNPTLKTKHIDYPLLTVTLLLMAVGIMMVYSSSAIFAQDQYQSSAYFLKRELIFSVLGLGLIFVVKSIDYHVYYKLTYVIFFGVLILLVLVLIPGVGHEAGGARRWLRIAGLTIQPSEAAKLAMIMFLAYLMAKKGEQVKEFKKGFIPPLLMAGFLAGMVLLQRDLGTPVVMMSVAFVMLYVAGTRFFFLAGTGLMILPVVGALIYTVKYRLERFLCFLDPWSYREDACYQLVQSFVSFSNGGLAGAGLGQGKQKLFYLPEAHTDFIFSIIAEELGLWGSLLIIGLFAVFVYRCVKIALRAPDLYGMMLSIGIMSLLAIQALVNLGVVMGLLPTKGLTLPFISHGGTSLLVLCGMVGILLNISSQVRRD